MSAGSFRQRGEAPGFREPIAIPIVALNHGTRKVRAMRSVSIHVNGPSRTCEYRLTMNRVDPTIRAAAVVCAMDLPRTAPRSATLQATGGVFA
jgi:hypothetical protein